MKLHEIDLSGLYLSLYTDDSGAVLSVELKKKVSRVGEDIGLPITLPCRDNIYTEEVIE